MVPRLFGPSALLLALASAPLACSGSETSVTKACPPEVETTTRIAPRALLPDLSGLGAVNCGTGAIDAVKARTIYDAFFGPRMPKTEADFQFVEDPSLLSVDIVQKVAVPAVYGETVANYHALFSFDPTSFARPSVAKQKNIDLFPTFGADARERYQRANVVDYLPATLTHYARIEGGATDIMATQFVFRMACEKTKMEAALSSCPDCVDAFAPLSREDIGRVLEIRIARKSAAGKLEVSRPLRVVGVDSSGAIIDHATKAPYAFLTVGGVALKARWRGEISGKMALTLGTYGHPTPALIRAGIGLPPGTKPPAVDGGAPDRGESRPTSDAGEGAGAGVPEAADEVPASPESSPCP